MNQLRIGLAGVAHDHAQAWARTFRRLRGVSLVGIWDDDPVRGRRFAEAHQTAFVDQLDALLDAARDGVGICSETNKHRDIAVRAAEAGIPMLCEKPMAATLSDCNAIIDACSKSRVVYVQSFPQRLDPAGIKVRELVRSGAIGRVSLLRKRHGHFYGLTAWAEDASAAWLRDKNQAGGGALLDEGIHGADYIRWILGDPVSVQAVASTSVMAISVDDVAIAVFRFESGALAVLETSWAFHGGCCTTEIYGESGMLLQCYSDGASTRIMQKSARSLWHFDPLGDLGWQSYKLPVTFAVYQSRVAEAFIQVLRGLVEPAATAADGREALRMILAAYRSSEEGREVHLAEVG